MGAVRNLQRTLRAGLGAGILASAALAMAVAGQPAHAQTTGVSYHFLAPPIASAGSIGPSQSVSFTLRVLNNGVPDPGGAVDLGYFQGGHVTGDSTGVPASQCGGNTALPTDGSQIQCTADSRGQVLLTYTAPAQPPAQGRADWVADASPGAASHAVTHYVYCAVYRFSSSPIAPGGSLSPGASKTVTLTSEDGLDRGIPNDTVYLSLKPATGSNGSASVGSTALSKTPKLFTTDSSGALQVTYTAPSSSASGSDAIVVQDLATKAQEMNSDSYAFAASPVVSVGDVGVFEGDQIPGIPAQFTVTITPVQSSAVTVQYRTLCGIGDKGCGEDFVQVGQLITVTIPANTSSTNVLVRQFSYVGGKAGETYDEGWFVQLANPSTGVLGRSVGEGVLLPDVEGSTVPLGYLYTGNAGVMPTPGATVPLYFTVTLGAVESSTVSFTYNTSNGSAVGGTDYVPTTGVATIPAGQTSAVIKVDVLPNAPPSTNKTFSLTISGASGAMISNAGGTGTILAG